MKQEKKQNKTKEKPSKNGLKTDCGRNYICRGFAIDNFLLL